MNISEAKTVPLRKTARPPKTDKSVVLAFFLFVFLACTLFAIWLILDRMWTGHVFGAVRIAQATADGSTVDQVLAKRYGRTDGPGIRWWVENGDFLYLAARVSCEITSDGSPEPDILAWQWDRKWPSPRALTPSTAQLCPELDPHCLLTRDGRTTLWTGRRGLEMYFKTAD